MSIPLPDDEQRWESRRRLFSTIIPEDKSNPGLQFPMSEVVALLNRPWWRRMWIVQEVVLARKVYVLCGSIDTSFGLLTLGFTMLFSFQQVNAFSDGKLESRMETIAPILNCDPRLMQAAIRGHGQKGVPLRQRVREVQGFHASVKQDYIYGLLGMVSDVKSLGIHVDYTWSPAKVFTHVARALLERQKYLPVLSKCRSPKSVDGIPSWVPDWSQPLAATIWNPDAKLYDAGGPKIFQSIRFSGDHPVISGYDFDAVSEAGPFWSDGQLSVTPIEETARGILREIESFTRSTCSGYNSEHQLEAAIIRTPISDVEMSTSLGRDRKEIRAIASCRSAFLTLTSGEQHSEKQEQAALLSYLVHLLSYLKGRKIFATKKGYLGLGPASVLPGDMVCVLRGAQVPFVLRELEGAKRTPSTIWKREKVSCALVGEC